MISEEKQNRNEHAFLFLRRDRTPEQFTADALPGCFVFIFMS
jgi:hypothetical protein